MVAGGAAAPPAFHKSTDRKQDSIGQDGNAPTQLLSRGIPFEIKIQPVPFR